MDIIIDLICGTTGLRDLWDRFDRWAQSRPYNDNDFWWWARNR